MSKDFNWNKDDVRAYGILCAILGFIIGVLGTIFVQEINNILM